MKRNITRFECSLPILQEQISFYSCMLAVMAKKKKRALTWTRLKPAQFR